jgi:hypothetical protein
LTHQNPTAAQTLLDELALSPAILAAATWTRAVLRLKTALALWIVGRELTKNIWVAVVFNCLNTLAALLRKSRRADAAG